MALPAGAYAPSRAGTALSVAAAPPADGGRSSSGPSPERGSAAGGIGLAGAAASGRDDGGDSPAGIATGSSPWAASQPAGGATITGKVFLQGRTATFPPQIGHGIATVTLIPGDDCNSALVPPGNIQ